LRLRKKRKPWQEGRKTGLLGGEEKKEKERKVSEYSRRKGRGGGFLSRTTMVHQGERNPDSNELFQTSHRSTSKKKRKGKKVRHPGRRGKGKETRPRDRGEKGGDITLQNQKRSIKRKGWMKQNWRVSVKPPGKKVGHELHHAD